MGLPDTVVVALVVLVVATVAGTASAAGNTPPLADAGLDQRVTPNTTVYLDANESRDPDGEIASVEWGIETPAGDTTSPDCDSCRQTAFDAEDTGQYNVTLSVTDNDGATRSDTLYVTVAAGEGPSVTLSGPALTSRNSGTEFTATVESDDANLQSLAWVVDGDVVDQRELDGTNATVSDTHSFDETGDKPVRAVAYDTLGHRGADERTVTVGTPIDGGGGGRLPACPSDKGGPQFDSNGNRDGCYDGEDRLIRADGETYVQDVNGKAGIQVYDEGELLDIGDPQENEHINANGEVVGGSHDDLTQHLADGNPDVQTQDDIEEAKKQKNSGGGGGGGGDDDDSLNFDNEPTPDYGGGNSSPDFNNEPSPDYGGGNSSPDFNNEPQPAW